MKCYIDILTQMSAARAALNMKAMLILRKPWETCVAQAVHEGSPRQEAVIDEMMSLLARQVV